MTIESIMEIYYTGLLPTDLAELGRMQSHVDDCADASLAMAHSATDPDIQMLNLNTHISYKTISDHLSFLIRKQRCNEHDHDILL